MFPSANFSYSWKKLWFWALMMILFSLSCNSSVFKLTCLRWSSDEWQLFRNLLFHPLTLISLFYFEKLCGSNTPLIFWEENGTVFCTAAFFRFDFASPGRSKTLSGHFSSSVFKNCGPFHQSVLIDIYHMLISVHLE